MSTSERSIGFFSLRFARWVSGAGRVLALEPDPKSLARLRHRLERAGLTKNVVDCIQVAERMRAVNGG